MRVFLSLKITVKPEESNFLKVKFCPSPFGVHQKGS